MTFRSVSNGGVHKIIGFLTPIQSEIPSKDCEQQSIFHFFNPIQQKYSKGLTQTDFQQFFVSFLLFQFCKGIIHKFLSWKTEYFFGISWNTLRFYLVPFQNTCFKYFQVKFFLFSFLFFVQCKFKF